MSGKIPQSFIQDLVDHIDILDVVEPRVKLKKTGKNYSGLCPFHNEKSPSFTVNTQKQFYYCFGCGAGGSALNFLMDYEKYSFVETIEELARIAGMDVPRDEKPEQIERQLSQKSLYTIMEQANDFFKQQLTPGKPAQHAIDYLSNRGLTPEIAQRFQIGFAPQGWDNLKTKIANNEDTLSKMIELGLLVKNDEKQRIYDFFRDRVMFPIRDTRGRCIGFGGRILTSEKTAKYLNSPETPIFHKGKELYGLYEAKKYCQNLNKLLVVEGYIDVIALAQYDINYAVATLGTATSEIHIQRMSKMVPEIIFCFDGDAAGRKAAMRAAENALALVNDQLSFKFLFLPDGEDPDSMVRKEGKEAFEQRLKTASHLSDFLFDRIGEEHDLSSMDGKARFSNAIISKIDIMPESILRKMMYDRISNITGLNVNLLKDSVVAPSKKAPHEQSKTTQTTGNTFTPSKPLLSKTPSNKTKSQAMTPARRATALLILQPSLAYTHAPMTWLETSDKSDWQLLIACWQAIHNNPIKIQHNSIAWDVLKQQGLGGLLGQIEHSDFFITNQSKELAQISSEFAAILQDLAELNPENELRQLSLKRQQNQISDKDAFKRLNALLKEKSNASNKKNTP